MKVPLSAMFAAVMSLPAGAQSIHSGAFEITTSDGGTLECLTATGMKVQLQPCQRVDAQRWLSDRVIGDWVRLRNVAVERYLPDQCLFTYAHQVRMASCRTGEPAHRIWRVWNGQNTSAMINKDLFDRYGESFSHLQRTHGGFLGFGGARTDWQLAASPDYFELTARVNDTSRCLGVSSKGQRVELQSCSGSDVQQWVAWGADGEWQGWKNRALLADGSSTCLTAGDNGLGMSACRSGAAARAQQWQLDTQGNHDRLRNHEASLASAGQRGHLAVNADGDLTWSNGISPSARWQSVGRYGSLQVSLDGKPQCLALSADNLRTELAGCQEHARQEWEILNLDSGSSNVFLRNRALAATATPICLGHQLQMLPCSGSGLTSMRTWRYATVAGADGRPTLLLSNKYLSDIGRDRVLAAVDGKPAMIARESTARSQWHYHWPLRPHPVRPLLGEKKVLLLHAQWSDRPATDFSRVRQAVFGDVDPTKGSLAGAVRLSSGNRTWLRGDAFTGFNLGPRPADCTGYTGLRNRLIELARQRGIKREEYDFLFIEVPPVKCGWAAVASMPGRNIFAQGSGHKHWMWQHEFGHNLGGPHSTALQGCAVRNGAVRLDDNCRVTRAGDPSDTLNGGGRRLFPLPYVLFAGWRGEADVPLVSEGTYRLAPLFAAAAGSHTVRGLRVLRSDGSYLTLEHRQRHPFTIEHHQLYPGAYEDWPFGSAFSGGLIARVARFSSSSVRSQIIDAAPFTSSLDDAPLRIGQSLDDPLSGVRVTLLSVDASGAQVRVQRLSNP